jgi:multicomponent K+:H+ antiporter subunit E
MTKLVPYPLASAGLLALWLLLNQTASLGQLLIGAAVALVGGWMLSALELRNARPRRIGAIFRLAARVIEDIVRSNIAVARIVLGLAPRPTAGFVHIKLELRSPYALATLACIITSTPGTIWADFDPESRILVIHVLDLVDESDWIRTIGHRYQRPLLEIFG